jgi:hypothetical protein
MKKSDPIKKVSVETNFNNSNNNGNYNEKSSTSSVTTNEAGEITGKRTSSNNDNKYRSATLSFDSDGNVIGNFEKGDKGRMIFGRRAEKKFNRIEKRNNEN